MDGARQPRLVLLMYGRNRSPMDQPRMLRPVATGVSLLVGGLGLFCLAAVDFWDFSPLSQLLQHVALSAVAVGLSWLIVQCAGPLGARSAWWKELAALLATAVLIMAFIQQAGQRQYGGYDLSIMIEAGWRQLQGQRPLADFPCSLPPSYLWGIKWAFELFGVSWYAIVLLSMGAAVLLFAWTYALLRALMASRPMALLLAASLIAQTLLLSSYWYYNQLAAICVVITALSIAAVAIWPRSHLAVASLALAIAAIVLGKPNTWIIGLGILPLLTSLARLRALALSGAIGLSTVLLLAGIEHYDLLAMLKMYRGLAHTRGSPFSTAVFTTGGPVQERFTYAVGIIEFLPLLVALLIRPSRPWGTRERTLLWCCSAGILAGAFAVMTNMELKFSDLAPVSILSAVAACALILRAPEAAGLPDAPAGTQEGPAGKLLEADRQRIVGSVVLVVVLFAALSGIANGWARVRIFANGPGFYEREPLHRLRGPALLSCIWTGDSLQRTVDQLGDLVSRNPGVAFFFGGRIDFAYAAWRLPSPAGLPLWWLPGTAFPIDESQELIRRFDATSFGLLVFHKNDMPFQDWVRSHAEGRYVRDDATYGDLTVFRRRE